MEIGQHLHVAILELSESGDTPPEILKRLVPWLPTVTPEDRLDLSLKLSQPVPTIRSSLLPALEANLHHDTRAYRKPHPHLDGA